jgi:hypothetical protein
MRTETSHDKRKRPLKVLIASLMIALPTVAQSVSPQLFNDMDWRLIGPFRADPARIGFYPVSTTDST